MARWLVLVAVLFLGLSGCGWAKGEKCVVCDQAIWGPFRAVTVEGKSYALHPTHLTQTCEVCGGLLAPKTKWGKAETSKEGKTVCHKCNKEIVRDAAAASGLVREVRADLARMGVNIPWGTIPVTVEKFPNPKVMAHTSAARYPNGTTVKVWIQFRPGMSRTEFKSVAAHELTHAWAYTNRSPNNQNMNLSEGAPQVVAYMYLEKDKSPAAQRIKDTMMSSSDGDYAVGFRRLLKYKKDKGLPALLTVLRTGTKIPKGY